MVYKKAPAKSKSIEEIVGNPAPNGEVSSQMRDPAAAGKLQEDAPAAPTPIIRQSVVREHIREMDDLSAQTQEVSGILDIQHEGHGFFAAKVYSFKPGCLYFPISNKKIYAAPWGLDRRGWKASKDTERYYGLLKVEKSK